MIRHVTITTLLLILLAGCEQEAMRYASHDNMYFDYSAEKNDSLLVYTFAYKPTVTADTLYLKVRLSGVRVPFDRKFKVAVDPRHTTAVPEVHYQPLEEFYTLDADSGVARIPIILYNKDRELENASVQLAVRLYPTDALGTAFSESLEATIKISNQLEKPLWWELWSGSLKEYSQVKHALYLIAVGDVALISEINNENGSMVPYDLFIIDKFREFLNDPITWVGTNTMGFELKENPDGAEFDFYNTGNPIKVFTLRLNQADGKYYFIDENGNNVTMN